MYVARIRLDFHKEWMEYMAMYRRDMLTKKLLDYE